MAIGGGGQARHTAVAASARAEDAALQALEAAEEAKDRPRWIAPAMATPPPELTGFFGRLASGDVGRNPPSSRARRATAPRTIVALASASARR